MSPFFQLLGFGLLAAAGNLVGGLLITKSQETRREQLKYLIALGAVFMLAAVFLEVIPEIIEHWRGSVASAMGLLLAGYLLLQLAEHTIAPHFHFGEEIHSEEILRRGAATTAVV